MAILNLHFPAFAIDTPVAPFFAWIWFSSDCKYMYFTPPTVTPFIWNELALLNPLSNDLISSHVTYTHNHTARNTCKLSIIKKSVSYSTLLKKLKTAKADCTDTLPVSLITNNKQPTCITDTPPHNIPGTSSCTQPG